MFVSPSANRNSQLMLCWFILCIRNSRFEMVYFLSMNLSLLIHSCTKWRIWKNTKNRSNRNKQTSKQRAPAQSHTSAYVLWKSNIYLIQINKNALWFDNIRSLSNIFNIQTSSCLESIISSIAELESKHETRSMSIEHSAFEAKTNKIKQQRTVFSYFCKRIAK